MISKLQTTDNVFVATKKVLAIHNHNSPITIRHSPITTRMKLLLHPIFFFCCLQLFGQNFSPTEIERWQQQAQRVSISRDSWGIAHIYGKTDADVVFGTLFAQCEDDFERVEMNYIDAIGRMAEVEGEALLYHDLRARMFLDTTQVIAIYAKSPAWMKKLLNAFADGVNYYLHTHPEVKPKLLLRFEPWMPLMFSEGSIGGNITVIDLPPMQAFYEQSTSTSFWQPTDSLQEEPVGSNGFAIAPSKSATGNALLLINPHTSFYFRSEVQMVSEEGLNAYGAVTWGQFFVYQGFNETCGWMHTSSSADSVDEYLETIEKRGDRYFYKYGNEWRPIQTQEVRLPYQTATGQASKTFTIYRTHHGPVIRAQDGKWVTIRMMNQPLAALSQSYLRTKAKGYKQFNKTMKMRTNSSNNTVFADRAGNIAYWHGNFVPKRQPSFDWNMPVDGSNPATDWQGLHNVKDLVQFRNPKKGWIQNCNATPFTASGDDSPKQRDYPSYMAPDAENYRGINAVRVLESKTIFTLDTLIAAANNPYLAGFEQLIPNLIATFEASGNTDTELAAAIDIFRSWDKNYSTTSVATTLAVFWGEKMTQLAISRASKEQRLDAISLVEYAIQNVDAQEKLDLLAATLQQLTQDFGTWRQPWGEINRFQRLTGQIKETFNDQQPSIPVGFTSSFWGSLAAYGARRYPNTKKLYGYRGNSFVAVVEFGERLNASAVVSGGASSDPESPNFTDQAALFCKGAFRKVWFYPEEVKQHTLRTYSPGK